MIPCISRDTRNFFALRRVTIFGSGWMGAATAKNGCLFFFKTPFIIYSYGDFFFRIIYLFNEFFRPKILLETLSFK